MLTVRRLLEKMMRKVVILFFLSAILFLALNACGPDSFPASTATVPALITASPTLTKVPSTPTLTPTPKGKTFVVTSKEDSGSGTLREAMQEAGPGDTIAFDASVFPSDNPKTIYLHSTLPDMAQGYVTIDADMAGVILDGSNIPEGWNSAIQVLSNNNIIRGLTLINLSGAALQISGGQNNLIEGNVAGNSDFGIGMWGANASGNRLKANYLGVMLDGVSPLGNKTAGIIVMEEAHDNLIGPDNQIAFNSRSGVEIYQSGTTGNTIFENSIHDNGMVGIALWDGGNNSQTAPILMDFDLAMGSVSGIACPSCEILLYSDTSDEGAVFEGQTTADEKGAFSFEKGSKFNGPSLTATATDPQGNTSGFSIPTTGNRLTMQIQSGNDQPRTILVTKQSGDLEDNRLGGIWSDFWQTMDFYTAIEDEITSAGLKLVKITMNQAEFYSNEQSGVELYWDKPELFISPEFDAYISQLVSHKITIYYMLNFWDKANHPDGWNIANRFETEEDITHYLEYVRFIVTQFKGRVQYYELWNEPDAGFPLQYIEPEDYINLAKLTIPVIKEIDPQAKVVVGCTSGTVHPSSRDYLFKILNSEVMPIADVVSWHPLFGNIPDNGQYPEYYASYPSLLANIIDTARKNGFQGEFIAGEISYGGPQCGGCDVVDPSYTEVVWAKYTARGIILHFGNDVAVSVGGLSSQRRIHFNTIRNIANVFSGVYAEDFAVEVQTESQNFKAFTFAGVDGSKLVALWTDGVAVNDDPGILSSITIPGFSGWYATGIEILNGFEQQLTSNNENGNLVIRDLLIKDYPIIIRLSK
jgi:parallel beta-helix repeat protein